MTGTGTAGARDGSFSQDLDAHRTVKPSSKRPAGTLAAAQLWYRDPLSASNQTTSPPTLAPARSPPELELSG